jgi:hypothetical protein
MLTAIPARKRTESLQIWTSTGMPMLAEETLEEPFVFLPEPRIHVRILQSTEVALDNHHAFVKIEAGNVEFLAAQSQHPQVRFDYDLLFVEALNVDDSLQSHLLSLQYLDLMGPLVRSELVQGFFPPIHGAVVALNKVALTIDMRGLPRYAPFSGIIVSLTLKIRITYNGFTQAKKQIREEWRRYGARSRSDR